MAGLLDWLTDGTLGSFSGASMSPQISPSDSVPSPAQPAVSAAAAPNPRDINSPNYMPLPADTPPTAGAPPPVASPAPPTGLGSVPLGAALDSDPMAQAGASFAGNLAPPTAPAAPAPVPAPAANNPSPGAQPGMDPMTAGIQPVPTPGAVPPPPPETPPGAPLSLAPPAPGASGIVAPAATPGSPSFMDRFKNAFGKPGVAAGLGAGLTAAGNSRGQSPFQAFAGGAGATLTGQVKDQHDTTKDMQGYLHAAIAAKSSNDEAAYKTNIMQYNLLKLKAEQEKAANPAAANKNDSPSQLYLSAQRLVEPDRKAANTKIQKMIDNGEPPAAIAAARAQANTEINAALANHYATLGLHPQVAATVAQQPGMSVSNPVEAASVGITADNISKKLQPGQYYRNPADGQVYQYKGSSSSGSGDTSPLSKRTPASKTEDDEDND